MTERKAYFTYIPPHVIIMSEIEGIWSGQEALMDDMFQK